MASVRGATRTPSRHVASHSPTVTLPGSARVPASEAASTFRISLSAAGRDSKPRRMTGLRAPSAAVTVHLKYQRVPALVSYS